MLRLFDRGLAVVSWIAVALVVVLLFAGPSLIGAKTSTVGGQSKRRAVRQRRAVSRSRAARPPGPPSSPALAAVAVTRSRLRARPARSAPTSISCDRAPRPSPRSCGREAGRCPRSRASSATLKSGRSRRTSRASRVAEPPSGDGEDQNRISVTLRSCVAIHTAWAPTASATGALLNTMLPVMAGLLVFVTL